MARLNIEDCWWTDPRRSALIRLLGGDEEAADGTALRAWRLAQEFWKHDRQLIPEGLFSTLRGAQEMIQVGLADVRDAFVYVRGSSAYLDWVREKRQAGRAGGKLSAKRPRDAKGRLQAKSKHPPSSHQAEPKQIQASYSSSSSFSGSDSFSDSGSNSEIYSVGGEPSGAPAAFRTQHPSPVRFFIGNYVKAYQRRYGAAARPSLSGKVQGQIKRFLDETPLDRACELILVYVSMNDPWFITKAHDFTTFVENLSKVGLALDTGTVVTRKEAQNAESADFYRNQMARLAGAKP